MSTRDHKRAAAWKVLGSIDGTGTMLVGPSTTEAEHEMIAVAPPGVALPSPEGSTVAATTHEWRIALWKGDEQSPLIDVEEPRWQSAAPLVFVLELVARLCPDQLPWVADTVERQIRNSVAACRPDRDGKVFGFADRWKAEAEAALYEFEQLVEAAAGDHPPPLARYLNAEPTAESLIAEVQRDEPLWHFDERLRPGAMREILDRAAELVDVTTAAG